MRTAKFIEARAQNNPPVRLIVLGADLGDQSAIFAGLSFASENRVGIMDADLHDEQEVFPGLVAILFTMATLAGISTRAASRVFFN
jgi:hypothetical protein